MKKFKLIIAAAAVLGLALGSVAHADGFAPGEGLYIGAFVGHGAGHVDAKVNSQGSMSNTQKVTSEITDGGIGLSGVEGGGWLGYGYKMGDLYVGWQMDGAAGGGEFKITSDKALMTENSNTESLNLTEVSAEMKWNAGFAGRIGYYVNQDTLFAIHGGISAAEFDVKWANTSDTFYGGGPRLGASLESRLSGLDPNLSVKLSGNYVDYMSASVSGIGTIDNSANNDVDSEVSGAAYNMRLGLQYSFFDVNSLF